MRAELAASLPATVASSLSAAGAAWIHAWGAGDAAPDRLLLVIVVGQDGADPAGVRAGPVAPLPAASSSSSSLQAAIGASWGGRGSRRLHRRPGRQPPIARLAEADPPATEHLSAAGYTHRRPRLLPSRLVLPSAPTVVHGHRRPHSPHTLERERTMREETE